MKREKKEKKKRVRSNLRGNQVNWYRINKLCGGRGRTSIFTYQEENEEK